MLKFKYVFSYSFLLLLFLPFTPPSSLPASAPPRFTKIPTDQIGVSGGVASFVCQAIGNPKPVVYWNKKGKKVNSQRIEVVVTVHNVTSFCNSLKNVLKKQKYRNIYIQYLPYIGPAFICAHKLIIEVQIMLCLSQHEF